MMSCVSMNNRECKVRLRIVSVNGDGPVFFRFGVETSKCSGSCSISLIHVQSCVL